MRALRFACLLSMCGTALPLGATEAIQSLVGLTDFAVITDQGAGFAFKPATNLYISALGHFFTTNFASLDSAVVELQDSRGNVRASVTLTNNSPQAGDWSYQPITPFFVPANSTNYLVAYDPVQYAADHIKTWWGYDVQVDSTKSTGFGAAPELVYLGPTDGTNIIGPPTYYFIGANFQFGTSPGPPVLGIALTRTNSVILFWPTQAAAFSLQATTNLLSWPVTNLTNQPTIAGTNNMLVLPRSQPGTFFRLIQ